MDIRTKKAKEGKNYRTMHRFSGKPNIKMTTQRGQGGVELTVYGFDDVVYHIFIDHETLDQIASIVEKTEAAED